MKPRQITYAQAINEALDLALETDPNVLCFGLGVPDPKGVFGTTIGLQEKHGETRVFDMPTSENGMTGIAIGAALSGMRPVMTHQRLDFFLLAMDQLVNNAAKWHYMFGGQSSVPLTIRLILGRGWGQGPTHSQNLQSWFAHIPGLKVVMPSTPEDAKGLLIEAIFDPNPVIFLEHRWLHNSVAHVPEGDSRIPLGKARVLQEGVDLTVIAMSTLVPEARRAAVYLSENEIDCDIIDLRSLSPLDWQAIYASVQKTGRLLVLDTGSASHSIAAEIVAKVSMECWSSLKCAPHRIAMPDIPVPTSFALTKDLYPSTKDIVFTASKMLDRKLEIDTQFSDPTDLHDIPGAWFSGPF
jgi:pyruvate dehydrogenase E1 component beta subunit